VIEAALGASMVWLAWNIGLELTDDNAAVIAAAGVALNPYAIVHDTALQETTLFTASASARV
jgi:hypothetical protein